MLLFSNRTFDILFLRNSVKHTIKFLVLLVVLQVWESKVKHINHTLTLACFFTEADCSLSLTLHSTLVIIMSFLHVQLVPCVPVGPIQTYDKQSQSDAYQCKDYGSDCQCPVTLEGTRTDR